jgi:hypothetical protein
MAWLPTSAGHANYLKYIVVSEIRLRRDCISSMRRNMNTHATNGSRNDALSKRITHFRKAFARGLGHRPTALQNAAMMRAATLADQAELVLADPEASINDKVRIDGRRTTRACRYAGRASTGKCDVCAVA